MDRGRIGLVALALLSLVGCAQETRITRVDSDVVTDLSGRWNDTDSRMVAETMVKEALEYPWLNNFSSSKRRQPVVVVGTIQNTSHEHINVNTFTLDVERALINSGKVDFVATKTERKGIREERKDQDINAREDTRNPMGKELGADFILTGTINTIVDPSGSTQVRFYQVNMTLTSLADNRKVWIGQKEIRKLVTRSQLRY